MHDAEVKFTPLCQYTGLQIGLSSALVACSWLMSVLIGMHACLAFAKNVSFVWGVKARKAAVGLMKARCGSCSFSRTCYVVFLVGLVCFSEGPEGFVSDGNQKHLNFLNLFLELLGW